MAIEDLNAAGEASTRSRCNRDTGEDVIEGVKAYEYLAETEEVDFIISGCIDDVSSGCQGCKNKIPTLDTWTSYIGIIDMVVED